MAVVTRSMTKNTECVLTDEAKRVSKAVSLSIPDLSDLSFLSQMNGVRNNIQILHWLNYLLLFFLFFFCYQQFLFLFFFTHNTTEYPK